jgi:hypothetical protein
MTKIENLLVSQKSVFNLQDLAVIWEVSESKKLAELVKYYVKSNRLIQIRRGIYAKNNNYSELELAQKIIPLSYITFHTALSLHGINFQHYSDIHSSSLQSRKIVVGSSQFVYHKIPEVAFYSSLGLMQKDSYLLASPERALCESLLFAPNLGFDHVDNIDRDKLLEIVKIYQNKRLESRVKKFIKKYL